MCVTKSPEVRGLIAAGPKRKARGANERELSVAKSVIRLLMGAEIAGGLI